MCELARGFGIASQHLGQSLGAGLEHRQQLGRRARDPAPATATVVLGTPSATTTLATLLRTIAAKWKHRLILHPGARPLALRESRLRPWHATHSATYREQGSR